MDNILISRANASDQPLLHAIWQDVFGDPPELILAFYDCFPPEISAWTVRCNGEILSAAYLIPGNWYMNRTELCPAGYVYAVATAEKHRGLGYAGRLMSALTEEANAREMMLYTRPAEASLFPWYAKSLSADHFGHMSETVIKRHITKERFPLQKISPEEYGLQRELLLQDKPHIVCSERFLRLQEIYSEGFYNVGDVFCCCTMQDSHLLITECLGQEKFFLQAAQALMERFDTEQAVLRLEKPEGTHFSAAYNKAELPEQTHWGLFLE